MKRLAYLFALIGLLGLIALVARQGAADVARVLAQAGWPLLLLLPLHALPLLLDAQGWRTLLHAALPNTQSTPPLTFLWWVASVREAVNRLLPTASVGGELVGIRLARLRLNDTSAIAASIVTEVMVTMFSYYVFTVIGVLALLSAMEATKHGWAIIGGLLLSLAGPILFALALHHGALFARLGGVIRHIFGESQIGSAADGARLDEHIRALVRRPAVLLRAMGWQLSGLLIGTAEVWLALQLLGHPVDLWRALFIEALTQAARQMAFFVPAGLGVQEAVVLMLGEMLGIGPDISLSLALVKRARELLFGVPALLSWQWLEVHRWRRQ
jgi:putative membrane protein